MNRYATLVIVAALVLGGCTRSADDDDGGLPGHVAVWRLAASALPRESSVPINSTFTVNLNVETTILNAGPDDLEVVPFRVALLRLPDGISVTSSEPVPISPGADPVEFEDQVSLSVTFRCDRESSGSITFRIYDDYDPLDRAVEFACYDPSSTDCGNAVREAPEACDGSDLGGQTCEGLGEPPGSLACLPDCTFDTSDCLGPVMCGDGRIGGFEDCDGVNLDGESCQTLGIGEGQLSCTADCQFDTSGCSDAGRCGNNFVEGNERCDGTDPPNFTCAMVDPAFVGGSLSCAQDCTWDTSACISDNCGNDNIDDGEDCDGGVGAATCTSLGFESGNLSCTPLCTYDVSACVGCGNGRTEGAELCDGTDVGDVTMCSQLRYQGGAITNCLADCSFYDTSNCLSPVCQNDVAEGVEACDGVDLDGMDCIDIDPMRFLGGTLACDANCQFDTSRCLTCGNGSRDGTEACEDTDLGGADCTTIGMGFLSGTLACASDCSFDTSGCSTTPPVCEADITSAFSPRCAGPAVADGPFGCRFTRAGNNFAQWFESTSMCTVYGPQQIGMDSTDLHCQTHEDGVVGCWYRVPSVGVGFAQLDPIMLTLGTPIVHTNLSGGSNYLLALDTALGYGSWVGVNRSISSDQLHAMTMMLDGTALQTFGPVSNVGGSITKSFAHVEGTMLHVVTLASGFNFETPVISEAVSINADLTNGMFTSARAEVENVPTGADRGTWDAVMLSDGRIRVFSQVLNTQTIGVTDHALGTLGGTSVQAIAIVGGTLLDFGVAEVPGSGTYLVAKVDIGGVISLRAYPIAAMPAATLDVTGGTEIYAGDADVALVVDGINTVVIWSYITSSTGHVISFPVP